MRRPPDLKGKQLTVIGQSSQSPDAIEVLYVANNCQRPSSFFHVL